MASSFTRTRLLRLAGLLVLCLVASGSLSAAFGGGRDAIGCSSTSAVCAPGNFVVDAQVGLGTVSLAVGGGDCSTALDACYTSCQAVKPTPIAECFANCDTVFYGCIGLID